MIHCFLNRLFGHRSNRDPGHLGDGMTERPGLLCAKDNWALMKLSLSFFDFFFRYLCIDQFCDDLKDTFLCFSISSSVLD